MFLLWTQMHTGNRARRQGGKPGWTSSQPPRLESGGGFGMWRCWKRTRMSGCQDRRRSAQRLAGARSSDSSGRTLLQLPTCKQHSSSARTTLGRSSLLTVFSLCRRKSSLISPVCAIIFRRAVTPFRGAPSRRISGVVEGPKKKRGGVSGQTARCDALHERPYLPPMD
jgi:hypothetical protein